jgi:hypothetical protein
MENLKEVKVTMSKVDTFLDLTYYNLSIRLWDGECLTFKNLASFYFYDVFSKVIETLDAMNQRFDINLNVLNNTEVKANLLKIVNVEGRSKALKVLAGTLKSQKTLSEFLKFHSVTIN